MVNKLENLLNFSDFEKSLNPKLAKKTDAGDNINEHLYMKVMNQESPNWKSNIKKFIESINKSIKDNQVKDIEVKNDSVTFKIRERKYKVNKNDESITLWRTKATHFRKKFTDESGRLKEEQKRSKTTEDIEVHIPIGKSEAANIYEKLKEMSED